MASWWSSSGKVKMSLRDHMDYIVAPQTECDCVCVWLSGKFPTTEEQFTCSSQQPKPTRYDDRATRRASLFFTDRDQMWGIRGGV